LSHFCPTAYMSFVQFVSLFLAMHSYIISHYIHTSFINLQKCWWCLFCRSRRFHSFTRLKHLNNQRELFEVTLCYTLSPVSYSFLSSLLIFPIHQIVLYNRQNVLAHRWNDICKHHIRWFHNKVNESNLRIRFLCFVSVTIW